MKEWKNPEMWELAAEYTQASLDGHGQDNVRISLGNGHFGYGANSN
ncbi:hypothetical protein ACJDU8_13800 [Clostridium sp. WILCCON 0269]|uniref:Uncharacterized protein n=1 Tax=Candidatus Clostridium eludens TaxID=3381663 RepID=A0ABW8SLS0_9CLOT